MNIPDSLLSSWEGSECSGGLLTFLLEVFPAFLDNRGQGLAFLVHIPLAYHFLNHFSGNGVQDDDGGRPENDIGGLGAYASHYFARFLRNELEGKGTRACLVSTIQKMNFLPEALLKVRSLICLSVKILQYTHQEDPVR